MIEPAMQLKTTLRNAHQSLTRSRQVVFEALLMHAPLSMHDLVSRCDGSVDRASVYRSVALFERLGIVQRLQMGWKFKLELSDSFTSHHHHLSCLKCGKIIDIHEDIDLERRLQQLAHSHGFEPQDHQLEIRGYCAACQASQPSTS